MSFGDGGEANCFRIRLTIAALKGTHSFSLNKEVAGLGHSSRNWGDNNEQNKKKSASLELIFRDGCGRGLK